MSSKYEYHSQINKVSKEYTDEDLKSIYNGIKQKIDSFVKDLPNLLMVNPELENYINSPSKVDDVTGKNVGGFDGDVDKFIESYYKHLDYIYTISTEEELEFQTQRCFDLFTNNGAIDVPVVIFFDHQLDGVTPTKLKSSFPTFYSYYEPNLFGTKKGGFAIAFPPRITELSDEELKVALAHEYGHIAQRHCLVHSVSREYLNQAMDYSINFQFGYNELLLYNSVANKLFEGGVGCTVFSWDKKDGGEGKDITISNSWQEILSLIKLFREKDQQQQQKEDSGEGSDSDDNNQQADDAINIGDIVYIRGTKNPKKYGRCVDIDLNTQQAKYVEVSEEEMKKLAKEAKNK